MYSKLLNIYLLNSFILLMKVSSSNYWFLLINLTIMWLFFSIFKLHTPIECGASVYHTSVSMALCHCIWSYSYRLRKVMWQVSESLAQKFNLRQLKFEVFILYLIFAHIVQSYGINYIYNTLWFFIRIARNFYTWN